MTKFKEVLEKAESFQKLAEDPKREFLRKLSQQTGEELSPYTVSYKGLDSLIEQIKAAATNVTNTMLELDSFLKRDSYAASVIAVNGFSMAKLSKIYNTYIDPAVSSLSNRSSSALKATKAMNGISLIEGELQKLDQIKSKLPVKLEADVGKLSNLLGSVHKYESKRSEWLPTDDSEADKAMTGQRLGDDVREFLYMLRQLHLDPNYNTPESLKQKLNKASEMRRKLESKESTLSPSVYKTYLNQLNMLEQQIKKEINKLKTFQPNS